jgi:hypothetical protein
MIMPLERFRPDWDNASNRRLASWPLPDLVRRSLGSLSQYRLQELAAGRLDRTMQGRSCLSGYGKGAPVAPSRPFDGRDAGGRSKPFLKIGTQPFGVVIGNLGYAVAPTCELRIAHPTGSGVDDGAGGCADGRGIHIDIDDAKSAVEVNR